MFSMKCKLYKPTQPKRKHPGIEINKNTKSCEGSEELPPDLAAQPFRQLVGEKPPGMKSYRLARLNFSYTLDNYGHGIGAWRLNGCAGDPSIMFGRDFLVTTKCTVDFGLGEMRVDLTILVEDRDIDTMLASLVEDMGEVGSASNELVKMGALDRKYKELEEQKPIVEVLENYMVYRKKLDEVMMGRARLENKNFSDEEKDRLIENGLPKKMYDPGNFVLPVQVNGTTQLSVLADMGASVSVLPYTLFKNLGLSDPKPYQSNLTMADNTQAKAIGEVRNVRIQIGYQAYLADFLVLDIPVDKELPLLLGRLFLRTFSAIIDMGRGIMSINDGVIRHTYFPKPKAKAYLENFKIDEDEDRLSCFKVGCDEDGNPSSLSVQLKNIDWGSEGHGIYKKAEGDGSWHSNLR
ncbi:DNA-directed DNA polymerase [Tanacetum coccineum]